MLLQNVRKLCQARGITLYRLEHDLGFGNGTVRKWEWITPRVDRVKQVADYFGVTVDFLMKEGNQ